MNKLRWDQRHTADYTGYTEQGAIAGNVMYNYTYGRWEAWVSSKLIGYSYHKHEAMEKVEDANRAD